MKKKRFIIGGIILLVIWFLAYLYKSTQSMTEEFAADPTINTPNIPADYLNLFKKKEKFSSFSTVSSKYRNPVSNFYYDNKYSLEICRLDTGKRLSLKKIIKESHINSHITYEQTYTLYGGETIDISIKSGRREKFSEIYLNIFGSSTSILKKNDSVAYYYSKVRNLYISYTRNGIQDIFAEAKHAENNSTPLELMFLKKDDNIYLIMMAADEKDGTLSPGTLNKIVCGN